MKFSIYNKQILIPGKLYKLKESCCFWQLTLDKTDYVSPCVIHEPGKIIMFVDNFLPTKPRSVIYTHVYPMSFIVDRSRHFLFFENSNVIQLEKNVLSYFERVGK